jgi:hypothetical protein
MERFSQTLGTALAIIVLLAGTVSAFGTDQPVVIDVALTEHGNLLGQMVSPQGIGAPEHQVVLMQGNKVAMLTTTSADGFFSFENVRGGMYQIVAGDEITVVRAWTAGTQPPVARQSVLLIAGNEVHRGQQGGKPVARFLTHPITLTAGVATAVALPVALHNSRRSPASPD